MNTTTLGCHYSVYSIVTRVDKNGMGRDGDVLTLTVPGCTALTTVRDSMSIYFPTVTIACFLTAMIAMLVLNVNHTTTIQQHGVYLWNTAVATTAISILLIIITIFATWALVFDSGFSHASASWVPYVAPLVNVIVAMTAWGLLRSARREMKTMLSVREVVDGQALISSA